MLTYPRQREVALLGGRQGNVIYLTLHGHTGFQRGLQAQIASDIIGAIFILDGWTSADALRKLHILGVLRGPLSPRYVNVLWVKPTCLTQNMLFFIIFHCGWILKQTADWLSCQEREVML